MILHSMQVENWRCFLEKNEVGPFSDRVNILYAPNATGKSTLLRIMAGEDTAYEGEVRAQKGIKIGFFHQEPKLDPDQTVGEAIAEAVAESPHGHEETGEHERVRVDDPQLLCAGRPEVARDVGQREAQNRVVDRDEQHGEHEHDEGRPPAPAHPSTLRVGDPKVFRQCHFYTVQPV